MNEDRSNEFLIAVKEMINEKFENVKKVMTSKNKKIYDALL